MTKATLTLGTKIFDAFVKGCPRNLNGEAKLGNAVFNASNPNVIEALPDFLLKPDTFERLSSLNGRPLVEVKNILNVPSNDSTGILNVLARLFGKKSTGFSELEIKALFKKAFPNGRPSEPNSDAFVYMNRLSGNVGLQYDAHGIAKIGITHQLIDLNKILTNGIDKTRPFCTAPLACNPGLGAGLGTAGGHAYRDGSFIVVSGKGKNILNHGIEHVIVNDAYYRIIDDLALKFPNVKFVRADQATEYFTKLG